VFTAVEFDYWKLLPLANVITILVAAVGVVYTQRTKVSNIEKWIGEHKAQTDLGYERLAATEKLTSRVEALLEQHDKRLDRLEREMDHGRD